MAIEDVTRRGVVKAMAEHDRLGAEYFLRHSGFRQARNHFVLFHGKAYSSGVANRFRRRGVLPFRQSR